MTERIGIRVYGKPITQGSLTRSRYGKTYYDTVGLEAWRAKVTAHAEDTMRYRDTLTGEVAIWLLFTFDRPKSHYRTGRNSHILKDSAPRRPTFKKDLDKLQRAIFDSLTDGKVWLDDGQVTVIRRVQKFYAGEDEHALPRAGVDIILEDLTPQTAPLIAEQEAVR